MEAVCANIQTLFLCGMRRAGADVDADVTRNAISLWVFLDKEIPNCNFVNVMVSRSGDPIFSSVLLEAHKVVKIITKKDSFQGNETEADGLLLTMTRTLIHTQFSIKDYIFASNAKARRAIIDALTIVKSLCAPLDPKSHNPDAESHRTPNMEFEEDKSLAFRVNDDTTEEELFNHFTGLFGPCIEVVLQENPRRGRMVFHSRQDVTSLMMGTVQQTRVFHMNQKTVWGAGSNQTLKQYQS